MFVVWWLFIWMILNFPLPSLGWSISAYSWKPLLDDLLAHTAEAIVSFDLLFQNSSRWCYLKQMEHFVISVMCNKQWQFKLHFNVQQFNDCFISSRGGWSGYRIIIIQSVNTQLSVFRYILLKLMQSYTTVLQQILYNLRIKIITSRVVLIRIVILLTVACDAGELCCYTDRYF